MDVTQKLMNEHKLIIEYLHFIQTIVRLEDTSRRDRFIEQYGNRITDFIQNFADKYHHAKEENILFRYMSAPHVLTHCNPLQQMLSEHSQGREFVAGMSRSLNEKNFPLFCENALAYAILLNEHIFKEDNVLYPMAENGLTPTEKKSVNEEYEMIEMKFNEKYDLSAFYKEMLQGLKNMLPK
ncbi:MAG: hemerythrin domain-containing protein [Oligoflexales bacterium]|nr:hemerythrin domain-containing protein [Oligoflexales bacterium]